MWRCICIFITTCTSDSFPFILWFAFCPFHPLEREFLLYKEPLTRLEPLSMKGDEGLRFLVLETPYPFSSSIRTISFYLPCMLRRITSLNADPVQLLIFWQHPVIFCLLWWHIHCIAWSGAGIQCGRYPFSSSEWPAAGYSS